MGNRSGYIFLFKLDYLGYEFWRFCDIIVSDKLFTFILLLEGKELKMTTQEKKEDTKKIYDYDDIVISLENSILPSEKLDETPSMKDGLDRDTENDIRFYGCELIQISGLLLKLPQV